MRCDEVDLQIEPFLEGDLPAERMAQLSAHLLDCPPCRALQSEAVELGRMLSHLPLPDLSPDFFERQRLAVMRNLGPDIVWEAPRLSLVLLFTVLGCYFAGSMSSFMDSLFTSGVASAWSNLGDVAPLYALLLLGGLATFWHDPTPAPSEVRS